MLSAFRSNLTASGASDASTPASGLPTAYMCALRPVQLDLPAQRAAKPLALKHQQGVTMVIALIVLVAMTLGGIALVRSVYTSNLIAGNLAFRKAAVSSGDAGVEAAVAWLQAPTDCPGLTDSCAARGYSAIRRDPTPDQSWDAFWQTLDGQIVKLDADGAGNQVSYVIHRLCNATGAASEASCSASPSSTSTEGQNNSVQVHLTSVAKVYYRITSRISGPRHTLTYTQTIVSM